LARWREPLTYYSKEGPVGQFFQVLDAHRPPRAIGLLGLGIGTMLCYGQPGQKWTIYEIDPLVERIARDKRHFRYFSDCLEPSAIELVHGDARRSLMIAPPRQFDLLVLDVFNSAAVPVHLLTREAFAIYEDRLRKHGLILVNFSNRYLNLKPILSHLVEDAGLHALVQNYIPSEGSRASHASANWAIIARDPADLHMFRSDPRWTPLGPEGQRGKVWTDDYSNILGAMNWRIKFHGLSEAWN
jgi:spermidine synthase